MATKGVSRGSLAISLLLVAFLSFIGLTLRHDGVERFGRYHDDTIYWNVAGAIAANKGAVVPSLPGEPRLTKYPPLYPYLLSAIWMPTAQSSGLRIAVGLSAAFAIWALFAAFLHFRNWRGVGVSWASACVGMCAVSGPLLLLSSTVLSDTMFFALAATAFLFADSESRYAWIAAAVFAGLATLTRSIGIAVAAGIAVSYFATRQRSKLIRFCLLASPFLVFDAAAKLSTAQPPAQGLEGYLQTWLYYSDYVGFWRTSMPDTATLAGLLQLNFLEALRSPAFLMLGAEPQGPLGMSLWATISVASLAGLYRQIRTDRVRAYHWALLLHVPLVLLWNFEIASRLLLIFLPLFWIGLSTELRYALSGFLAVARGERPLADRCVAVVFLGLLVSGAGWWAMRTTTTLVSSPAETESFALRYGPLIDWLRSNSAPTDRLVAIDEGFLYAHTGHQGMWPLALATDLRYRSSEQRLDQQLELMPDVANQIGARYLVWTADDYYFAPPVQERWETWVSGFCLVLSSNEDSVRLYDFQCTESAENHTSARPDLALRTDADQ